MNYTMADILITTIFTSDESKNIIRKGVYDDSLESILKDRFIKIFKDNKIEYNKIQESIIHKVGLVTRKYYSLVKFIGIGENNYKDFTKLIHDIYCDIQDIRIEKVYIDIDIDE